MPLPSVLFLAFATGIAAALAGRAELKSSPRPALVTQSALAFLIFDFLVLVPASAYFYVFHGDWFLLYALDVRRVPSALALVGFVFEGALAFFGFGVTAGLVRAQREALAVTLLLGALVLGVLASFLASDRLALVGSFAQYRGNFGLVPFGQGPVLAGAVVMGSIVAIGLAFLLVRIYVGARRQS